MKNPLKLAIEAARGAARRQLRTLLQEPMVTPRLGDGAPGMVWQPVTPEEARYILEAAARGDLQRQNELFGLMLDSWPRLTKNAGEVVGAVKRLAWQVRCPEPGNQEGEAWADLMRSAIRAWRPQPGGIEMGFEEALGALLDARCRGVSVVELSWAARRQGMLPRAGWWVGPSHVGWSGDGRALGLVSGRTWEAFTPGKFLVGTWLSRAGVPGATALLRPLVPYWVGRTYGWQWLLRTAQIFGTPFRWANYDDSKPETGAKVAEMLANLGQAGWAAFPNGTTLDFKEAVTSARDNPQVLLQEMADQACDLLILGQTLSGTAEGTGLGSGTAALHGQVRREVIAEAAAWVADVLNYQLVPTVVEMNWGADSDPALLPIVAADLAVPADPKAEAERLEILVRAGLRVPAKWAREAHGVPEPEEGEETLSPAGGFGAPGGAGGVQVAVAGRSAAPGARAAPRGGSAFPIQAEAMGPGEPGASAERFFEELTGVTAQWMGPVAKEVMELMAMAQQDGVSPEVFAQALERARRTLPELFEQVDAGEVAGALRRAMTAEVVNGAAQAGAGEGARA